MLGSLKIGAFYSIALLIILAKNAYFLFSLAQFLAQFLTQSKKGN